MSAKQSTPCCSGGGSTSVRRTTQTRSAGTWLQVLLREQGYKNFEPRQLDPAPGEPPFATDEDLRKQEQARIDELYPKCNMKRAYRDHKCACGFYLQPTHMDRHLDSRCHFVRMKCMKDGVYKFDKSVMMDADERGEFW